MKAEITAYVQTYSFDAYQTISSHRVRSPGDPASLIRLASELVPGCEPDYCFVVVTTVDHSPTFRVSFSNEPRSVGFDVPIAQLALYIAYILGGERANGCIFGAIESDDGGTRKRRKRLTPIQFAALAPASLSLQ
jgi:hypothetical protein